MSQAASIADQIPALTLPQKLRLAADLLEHRRPELAHSIAEAVVTELGAALALRALDERERRSRST